MKITNYLITAALALAAISPGRTEAKESFSKHRVLSPTTAKSLPVKLHSEQLKTRADRPWLMKTKKRKDSKFLTTHTSIKKTGKSASAKLLLPIKSAQQPTTLYGNLTYTYDWDYYGNPQMGIYSFSADMSNDPIGIIIDPVLQTTCGVMFEGAFYGYSYDALEDIEYWIVYDIDKGILIRQEPVDFSYEATDLTYDKQTGLIYGCFLNEEGYDFEFCSINPTTLERTVINDTNFTQYGRLVALATHPDGRMFGITLEGVLEQIDPSTGDITTIASVGLPISNYVQTATFDPYTGNMYWIANTADGEYLTIIDIDKLSLGYIGEFYNLEQWSGLYIPGEVIEDSAPAKVENLYINFCEGSTKGEITFNLPQLNYGGDSLSSEVDYTILIDDVAIVNDSGLPGAMINHSISSATGYHKFEVVPSNSFGKGEVARQRVWIGYDTPLPVTNVSLTFDDRKALLTWTAPQSGIHGGYVDLSETTYTITRLPDNVIVATDWKSTTYTEEVPDNSLTAYRYIIVPTFKGLIGKETVSNKVWNGRAFEVPYSNDFSDEESWGLISILDFDDYESDPEEPYAYRDNWWICDGYNGNDLRIVFTENQDDWAILPPMHMTTGRDYAFYGPYSTNADKNIILENIEIFIGEGDDLTTYTQLDYTLYNEDDIDYIKSIYVPSSEGDYRFALHATGPYESCFWALEGINIDVNDIFGAPDSVSDFKVTAAPDGSLCANVSFNAPILKCNGESLTSIDTIDIEVDGNIVKSFVFPVPGEFIEYQINNLSKDSHLFCVAAYNSAGCGRKASQKTFIGYDIPGNVPDLVLSDNVDNISIKWSEPITGVNGGYIDRSSLVYALYCYDSTYGNFDGIGETSNTEWTHQPVMSGEQRLLEYAIEPRTADGEGEATISSPIAVGDAWSLPFRETFTRADLDNNLWWNDNYYNTFYIAPGYITTGDDMDHSGGLACYTSDTAGSITSGKISLEGTINPAIIIGVYHFPNVNNTLCIGVTDDKGNLHTLHTVNDINDGSQEGWRQLVVSLDKVKNSRYVNLVLTATCENYDVPVMVDNIRVRDLLEENLTSYITTKDFYTKGCNATVDVLVENYGLNDAKDYTIQLLADGEEVTSVKGIPLQFSEEKKYTLSFPISSVNENREIKLEVKVIYPIDNYPEDNTHTAIVSLRDNAFPAPTSLAAHYSDNNETIVSWETPEIKENRYTTEDFETYTAWIKDGIGDWITLDQDGEITYSHSMIYWPNAKEPHAYMVFNPSQADSNYENLIEAGYDFTPYSGEQYLASFCPDEWYASNTQSDDWLISPELSGKSQTIKFMAKSLAWVEDINIYYSTDSNLIESFIPLEEWVEVPSKWTEFEVELPEGTKYFAIRHISIEQWALFIDDIKYRCPADDLTPLGFNVYRDGEKIAELDWDTLSFIDVNAFGQEYIYKVTACYDLGESAPVAITVKPSGLSSIVHNGKIADEGKVIAVYGYEGMPIEISSVDGKLIYSGIPDKTLRVNATSGIYIIKTKNATKKLIVK
ncbi:MAG: hypothetical protein HDR88_13770 [Bacteroides sp.]|nr:hypothetical protein [Bacteroides sp.]